MQLSPIYVTFNPTETDLAQIAQAKAKTGIAELSQTDELSWDIEADLVPAGFKVIQLQHGASCDIPVVP